jgi:hydrogenase-4 component B
VVVRRLVERIVRAELVLVAIALLALSGLPGLLAGRRSPVGERLAAALMVSGSLLGLVVAVAAMGQPLALATAWAVPGGEIAVRVDALAAVFLVPLFIVAPLGSVYGLEYWPQRDHPDDGRKLRAFYGLMTAGIALLVVAANAVFFLAGWEVMALAAFLCITTEDRSQAVRQSGYVYLVATRIGTLALFAMFAVLHAKTGRWAFARPEQPLPPDAATAVFVLALLGFGLKAGLMPLHVWLPGAHANAPSHVSAVMSGVLIKTGIYGIARVCSFFDHPPLAWGIALLTAGTVSGVLGVAFAIGQHDLKRLLAYHSVENIGIITMGLGIAMLGRTVGSPALVTLGLAGGLLHVWNHALFKALLFLAAGAVLHATGTRDIDALGGLARRMPRTALAFLLGAVAICGLPPLNGFVSELFVYLGCFQVMTSDLWIAGAVAAPALALIGALALACFVKAFGAVFLGSARSERGARAHDPGGRMLAPMAALAAGCIAVGLAPAAVAPVFEGAARAWAPAAAAPTEPLRDLAPLHALTATGIALALLAVSIAVVAAGRTRRIPVASAPTWDCGYAAPSARMQYTASSFAQTLVGFFSWALRPSVHAGAPSGLFPAPTKFETHVPDTVLERAIIPLSRGGARALQWFRWVQHGNVHLYLVYVLATLVILLLVGR